MTGERPPALKVNLQLRWGAVNAITPFPSSALPREPFNHAMREVNAWRGQCLDAFTRTEAAVTDRLVILSTIPERGTDIGLPHLVGQRLAALATAIDTDGSFANEGRTAAASLTRFREHSPLRTMLWQKAGDVTLDSKGRWTLVLRRAALRSGRVAREVQVIQESDAERLCAEVSNSSRSLRSPLDNLIVGLSAVRSDNA